MDTAAHAATQLMQLGQAKSLGMFNNHKGGVWNVHADFNNGGGNQHINFTGTELLHDIPPRRSVHTSVQKSDAMIFQRAILEVIEDARGTEQLGGIFINGGKHHVPLSARLNLPKQVRINFRAAGGRHARGNGLPARRKFVNGGNVQIAKNSHG